MRARSEAFSAFACAAASSLAARAAAFSALACAAAFSLAARSSSVADAEELAEARERALRSLALGLLLRATGAAGKSLVTRVDLSYERAVVGRPCVSISL